MLLPSELDYIADRLFQRIKENDAQPVEVTYSEACEYLKCSGDTLARKIKKAGVKTYRVHKKWAFDRKHLDLLRHY